MIRAVDRIMQAPETLTNRMPPYRTCPVARTTLPSGPLFGQGPTEMANVLRRLRSGESQRQLVNSGPAIARRGDEAFLRCAGYREGINKTLVEYPICRLAVAQSIERGDKLWSRDAALGDDCLAQGRPFAAGRPERR